MANLKNINIQQIEKLLYMNHEISEEIIKDYLQNEQEICRALIESYHMDLIYDVYINQIDYQTYNGYKRRRLRLEMLKLIELMNLANDIIELASGRSIECAELYKLIDICEAKVSHEGEK